MRRVDLDHTDGSQDNLLIHLARYKFIARLISKKDRVLEIGCGTGYGSRFISDYAKVVVGSDLEEEVLRHARSRFSNDNLTYVGDFEHLTPFDVVVCLEVIEHMDVQDGLELLRTVRRVLSPGGVAFISTPRRVPNPSENRRKFHVHEYEYDEFKSTLESVFARALIFTQIDEIISTQNPQVAWTFVACAYP